VGKCPGTSSKLKWDQSGVRGAIGPTGAIGPAGARGRAGATGAAGQAGPTGASGPSGGTGATGPPGPMGPAGSARDAGAVEPDGVGGAILYPSGLRGWTSVAPIALGSAGIYCLTSDASSTEANTTVLVSPIVSLPGIGSVPIYNGVAGTVAWGGYCPNGAVKVLTYFGSYLSNGVAFEAIIP
jgi:hypothetical protein